MNAYEKVESGATSLTTLYGIGRRRPGFVGRCSDLNDSISHVRNAFLRAAEHVIFYLHPGYHVERAGKQLLQQPASNH